jgi:hypothetical protein
MSILKLFEKYFSLQIYKIISKLVSIITFIFINREVLGGVLGASQRVLLILSCQDNDNEKGFIIEMYLDSISVGV